MPVGDATSVNTEQINFLRERMVKAEDEVVELREALAKAKAEKCVPAQADHPAVRMLEIYMETKAGLTPNEKELILQAVLALSKS